MTWNASTLAEIAERDAGLIQTGPFGSQLHQSDYVADGIPVIMPKDITEGRVDAASVARVSEETANRLRRHQLRPRTIVLPRRGEITKRAFIRDDQAGWLCGTGCLQIALEGKHLLPEFLYYYMEQKAIARWLEQHAVGTTMLNLSAGIVSELPLKYPLPVTQQRIADILSAYDDLIENNRRRMALLENAARHFYREWFVRLRFPGHEHTRITKGVPEGWTAGVVADFYDTASGGTPSRKHPEYFTGEIPWVKTQELINDFIIDTKEKITEDGLNNSSAKIFPERTVLVALYGATVGELGILANPASTNQACCAVLPKDVRAHFIHAFLFLAENKERLRNLSAGAAQRNISQDIIRDLRMVLPPKHVMDVFIESLNPTFDQRLNLLRHNDKLRAARDLVLPRLMSGEIAV